MVFLTRILHRAKRVPHVMREPARDRRHPLRSCDFFGKEPFKPDNRFERRSVFMMTAHCPGRHRNTYRNAKPYMLKQMDNERKALPKIQKDLNELRELRIEAGCAELNFDGWHMRESLTKAHVHLTDDILANLAIWEPRSFRSIVGIAADTAMKPTSEGGLGMDTCGPQIDVIQHQFIGYDSKN